MLRYDPCVPGTADLCRAWWEGGVTRAAAGLDLDWLCTALLADDQVQQLLSFDGSRASAVVREYRRFLTLKALRGDLVLPPPPLVDRAWHLHLCHTSKYLADSTALCGYFIHHAPNESFKRWSQQTLDIYRSFFGEVPPAWIWPALPGPRSQDHLPISGSDVELCDVDGCWHRGAVLHFDVATLTCQVRLDSRFPFPGTTAFATEPIWKVRPTLIPGISAVDVNSSGQGSWHRAALRSIDQMKCCNVDYDSGLQENGIPPRAIRLALPSDEPISASDAKGLAVEVNSRDAGVWHRGLVVSVGADGFLAVLYDDHLVDGGSIERGIPASHVHRLSVFLPHSDRPSLPVVATFQSAGVPSLTSTTGHACSRCAGRLSVEQCAGRPACSKCHGNQSCCVLSCWGGCG